jgi:hypothetical protein
MDWYSLSIYDVYFNDDYVDNDSINNNSNSSSDVSSTVIIDKLEVKCKENMKGVQYNFFVDLGYVDNFDYKFTIIIKTKIFKSYMNKTHADTSLRFRIHYSRSQWKRNLFLIDVYYVKFNVKELKLILKILQT